MPSALWDVSDTHNLHDFRPRAAAAGLWLGGEHDIVAVAEDEHLGCAPDDLFHVHHGSHLQPELPQQQVLDEIARQAPGPEWQMAIADRLEAEPAQLENQKVGAEKIVAPIVEEAVTLRKSCSRRQ